MRDSPKKTKRFRGEIAGWLEEHLRGEFEAVRGRGGPGDEHALFEERHAWERLMGQHGWIGRGLAEGAGRHEPLAHSADDLPRGIRAGGRAGSRRAYRRDAARADADPFRDRRAEATLPAEDPVGRGDLVPGLLGARSGLGSRRRCRRGPSCRATNGCSTVRRSGPRARSGRTGASSSAARIPAPAQASRHLLHPGARWTSPASRSGRSSR